MANREIRPGIHARILWFPTEFLREKASDHRLQTGIVLEKAFGGQLVFAEALKRFEFRWKLKMDSDGKVINVSESLLEPIDPEGFPDDLRDEFKKETSEEFIRIAHSKED